MVLTITSSHHGNQGKKFNSKLDLFDNFVVFNSSQFGFYDANETVINLMEREIYTEDLIGLKTLNKKGKLHIITVPGVNHFMWHKNTSIVDNYILPFLD